MQKYSRNSRISAITKILIENPNKIMSLNYFSEMLNAAKSTISEDILVIREILEAMDMGSGNHCWGNWWSPLSGQNE